MFRILAAFALAMFVASTPLGVSVAFADTWGCSYEKCLQSCAKASGKYCSAYCDKALKDKQTSKICK
jgi:hypothetical protein